MVLESWHRSRGLDLPGEYHDNRAASAGSSSTSGPDSSCARGKGDSMQTRTLRSKLTIALAVGALTCAVAVAAIAQNAGKSLIGKLEGPEVVTDAAKLPKTFKEAPQLAALVKAGKLPPVAERIGQDPLVIKPLHEVGKYGGMWRAGFTGPADFWNGFRCCSGPDHLMFWDYTGDKVMPNLANGLEMQDGGRPSPLHRRGGLRRAHG